MKTLIRAFILGTSLGMMSHAVYSSCQKHAQPKQRVVHKSIHRAPCCVVQGRPLYQRWPDSWGPPNECISERKREVHKHNCGI